MSNQVIVVMFVSFIEPLFETIFEFTGFGPEAKLLAREYYSLTGKPVGLREVAEYEAERILGC
jgi:hypothetical protein